MTTWIIIVASLILIIVFSLPYFAKRLINKKLSKIDGYKAHIERIKIRLLSSKIIIYNVSVIARHQEDKQPLLLIPSTTISFRWRSLLKRMLDLNILLDSPDIFIFTEQPLIPEKSPSSSRGLASPKAALERLMPFHLNAAVHNGKIRFINSGSKKKIELAMEDINLTISDLTNQHGLTSTSLINGNGKLYDGSLEMSVSLRPLEPMLTMDFNLQLKSINLVLLNDLLLAYGKVDANQGTLDLSAEVAVSDNAFKGYIKPVLKSLDFVGISDKNDSLFQKIWERAIAVGVQLLENNRKDQIATKIPIEGRLDDPHVHVVAAIIGILRNAFVKALTPSLEDIIDIDSIWKKTKLRTKGFFKSIFGNKNP